MEDTVKDILRKVCGPAALVPEVDLIESGILDSLALIELLSGLEDIGIVIQPTEVSRDAFRTIGGIVKLAEQFDSRHT